MSLTRLARTGIPLLLFVVTHAPAGAATIVSHPVPLQNSDCAVAPGTVTFTGHALFEYRIEPSGAVQGIKLLYADVQPPDRKPGFLSEVQGCLAKWKFRPATADGVPTATVMKVAFHRLPPAVNDGTQVMLPGGRVVPAALVKQVRTATLAFTETLLKGRGYTEARGNGWSLRTDLPKSSLDDIQKTLDFARSVFDEAFPGSAAPAGTPDVTMILFKDEEEYRQLSAFDNVIPERAPVAGQYDGEFRMIYSALGSDPMPIFARIMAHEATHHFTFMRLSTANGPVPRWLSEGIAQYVQCVKMAKPGKIRLEALDRGQVSQPSVFVTAGGAAHGAWIYPKRAEVAFSDLDQNLSDVDLAVLVDGRLDRHFFGEGAIGLYNVSWLLVQYLLNGDGGRHREAFRKWVLDPGAERTATTLSAAVGLSMTDLQQRLKAYLGQIK